MCFGVDFSNCMGGENLVRTHFFQSGIRSSGDFILTQFALTFYSAPAKSGRMCENCLASKLIGRNSCPWSVQSCASHLSWLSEDLPCVWKENWMLFLDLGYFRTVVNWPKLIKRDEISCCMNWEEMPLESLNFLRNCFFNSFLLMNQQRISLSGWGWADRVPSNGEI